MGHKYFLIINPAANSGKAERKYPKILRTLNKRGVDFDYRLTSQPGEAVRLAASVAKDDSLIVVAVGGDGTICEVISGLFFRNENNPKPALGILHIGTSPDFNKLHKIPVKIKDAINTLIKGKTKTIDIGKAAYNTSLVAGAEKKTSYFASNVNIGLGPQIAQKANSRYRKYLGDFLGTLCAAINSLIGFKGMSLPISIDGKDTSFPLLINLTVGKDPYLASGMRALNPIAPDDGRLYVLSIKKTSLINILSNIPKLYWGNILDYNAAEITYAKSLDIGICSDYPQIEMDGDVKGFLPARIEVLAKALRIIVP